MRNILHILGGVIPRFRSYEEQEADLSDKVNRAVPIEKLRTGKDWPAVNGLLQFFHDEAVQGYSKTGITPSQVERLNNRLEFIRHFREEIERIIYDGRIAFQNLEKLKEKQNV